MYYTLPGRSMPRMLNYVCTITTSYDMYTPFLYMVGMLRNTHAQTLN